MADADDGLLLFDNPPIDKEKDSERTHLDGFVIEEHGARRQINQMPMPTAINVLVGPNNAGKSRLMRQLFIQDSIATSRAAPAWIERKLPSHQRLVQFPVSSTLRVRAKGEEADDAPRIPESLLIANKEWHWRVYCPPIRSTLRFADIGNAHDTAKVKGLAAAAYIRSMKWTQQVHDWDVAGLANFGGNHTRMLATGAHLYEQVHAASHVPHAMRKRWREGSTKVLHELLGFRDGELVARAANGNLSEFFVSDPSAETSIHDLGDGISACLIILLPLLLRPETRGVLFIEEPELYLHPGLQRQLAKLLANPSVRGDTTLYMATHSPDFLDAMAEYAGEDLTVLRVENEDAKEAGGMPRHVVRPSKYVDISHLESIGAAAHALLARSLILVEGPSDVRYVRGLIELTKGLGTLPEHGFVEGRDYAVVTYGGTLLDDLLKSGDAEQLKAERLLTLNHYLFILSDEDIGKDDRHTKIRGVCQGMGGRVRYETTTPAVEFENAFSVEVWSKVLPKLKTQKWAAATNDFPAPSVLQSTRIQSVAKHVYEGESLPTAKDSKTLKRGKVEAGDEFVKLVRDGTITEANVGERALGIRTALIEFITSATRSSGANRTP